MVIENLIITILGGVMVAIIGGSYKLINDYVKKKKRYELWRKEEIDSNTYNYRKDNDQDPLKLVTSRFYIPGRASETLIEGEDTNYKSFNINDYFLNEKLVRGYPKSRFLILGGSGMGKSILSISLTYNYIKKYNPDNVPYTIRLFHLGSIDLKKIDFSKNCTPSKTVLILDALDENIDAIRDPSGFFKDLDNKTNAFRIVITTSRTQLFETKGSVPTKGGILQGFGGCIEYKILYMSAFSDDNVQKYLEKKFRCPSDEYSKAISIWKQSKDIMSRPLVLSFIEDLLNIRNTKELTTIKIYSTIVENWIERELEIIQLTKPEIGFNHFVIFSMHLAYEIYENWCKCGESSLGLKEYKVLLDRLGLSNDLDLFRQRSLIERKNDGSLYFAHRSFFEYFLAVYMIESNNMSICIDGLDLTKKIICEFYDSYLDGNGFKYLKNTAFSYTFDKTPYFDFTNYADRLENVLNNTVNGNKDLKSIYTLSYELIKYYCGLILYYSSLIIEDPLSQQIQNTNNKLYNCLKIGFISMELNQIQSILLSEPSIDMCKKLKKIVGSVENYNPNADRTTNNIIDGPTCTKTIIFPSLLTPYIETQLLSNHLIILQNDFSGESALIDCLQKVLLKKNDEATIAILLQGSLQDIIDVAQKIKSCSVGDLKGLLTVILISNVEGRIVYYNLGMNSKFNQKVKEEIERIYSIATEENSL